MNIKMLNEHIELMEKETGFEHGRIEVFDENDGKYRIQIDGGNWSNYLDFREAWDDLTSLFKGIELGKKGEIK